MIKLFYVALVLVVLLPGVFAAIASVRVAGMEKQIQEYEQAHAGDSAFVISDTTRIGIGRFGVSIYPRRWAAILVFAGFALFVGGLVFLIFVRQ